MRLSHILMIVGLAALLVACGTISDPESGRLSVKPSPVEEAFYNVNPETGELVLKPSVKDAADVAGAFPYGEIGGALALGALGLWQTFRNKRLKVQKQRLANSLTKSVDIALNAASNPLDIKEQLKLQQQADGTRAEIDSVRNTVSD